MERVKILGLLGGIGSGKSTIAGMFAQRGAVVLDADRMAHECLAEPEVITELADRFGPQILGSAGQIDRARLGAHVFDDPSELAALNAIIHPRVRLRMEQAIDRARSGNAPLIVLDVPLLLESPLDRWCDERLFIDVPEAERQRRVQTTRGWNTAELARRESAQIGLEAKRRAARFILDNARPASAVQRDVDSIFDQLVDRRPPQHD